MMQYDLFFRHEKLALLVKIELKNIIATALFLDSLRIIFIVYSLKERARSISQHCLTTGFNKQEVILSL